MDIRHFSEHGNNLLFRLHSRHTTYNLMLFNSHPQPRQTNWYAWSTTNRRRISHRAESFPHSQTNKPKFFGLQIWIKSKFKWKSDFRRFLPSRFQTNIEIECFGHFGKCIWLSKLNNCEHHFTVLMLRQDYSVMRTHL